MENNKAKKTKKMKKNEGSSVSITIGKTKTSVMHLYII